MEILSDKYIIGLYQELEREVIADIARRVKKTGRFTETAEIMAKSMKMQGYSPEQIRIDVMKLLRADKDYQNEVAQNTKEYKAYVQGLIDETYRKARENGEEMFDEAANMAFNNDLSMWEEHGEDLSRPSSLSQLAAGTARQTNNQFRNLTRSTGFRNTRLGTVGIMNAYQKEMDLATLKVATGVFSYDQAVRDCVTRLAQSGLRSIDYGSGRSYQLDTAARMCIRTGFGQLTGKITEENLKSMGHDLVITSQHTGSRPEHAVWQNKVFSYSGKNKKYPDFVKATGYGTVTGLMGANCRHDFYPYWEGDYIPPDLEEPMPVTVDGKEYTYYQATQRQRTMERNIRATKREIEAMGAIGEDTAELRRKLRFQTKEYHRFSDAVGIRAKNERLRVATGTSNLADTRSLSRINESRAKKEASERLFTVYPAEKGNVVSAEKIYSDLNHSDIGREVLAFIQNNNINVEIYNDQIGISDMQLEEVYGAALGHNIYINGIACSTKKKVVETIIHERTHFAYPDEDNQHVECVCDAMAMMHRKGTLTGEDLRGIIKSVKERYADKSWR